MRETVFSTYLKSISGYFNSSALVSGAFPSLVFWLLTACVVRLGLEGPNQWKWEALTKWNALKLTDDTFLMLGLLLWVVFWSLLTLNFHSTLLRLYEGYWPLAWLAGRRRARWQRRWDERDASDRALEAQEVLLKGEAEAYEELRGWLADLVVGDESALTPAEEPERSPDLSVLGAKVGRLEARLRPRGAAPLDATAKPRRARVGQEAVPHEPDPDALKTLAELGSRVRDAWRFYARHRKAGAEAGGRRWAEYRAGLEELTKRLSNLVDEQFSEVEEQRLRHNQNFFLTYPTHRDDVMPTLMGNVLKASQARVQLRYNIDALVLWPRLQPVLEKDAAEPIQSAKTSLDLMLTVSFGLLLFGLPLSLWAAFESTRWFLMPVPLTLLLAAIAARLWLAFFPAAAALVLSIVPSLYGASEVPRAVIGSEVFFTACAGLLLLSWVCYHNAVQACVLYGEKLQSAFDLYRWELLDKLHLQYPPDHREERELWGELGGLLYRGYEPSPDYYQYLKPADKTKKEVVVAQETVRLPVAARPLPAFRPIGDEDLVDADVSRLLTPADAVLSKGELIGRVPITVLPASKPIRATLLSTKEELKDHVAVGIDVSSAESLGGKLEPGDILYIVITPTKSDEDPAPEPIKYECVVLDVGAGSPAGGLGTQPPQSVVVIALPRARLEAFTAQKAGGTLTISRRI